MTDKDNFAKSNMGLVHSCCKRFTGKGIEYEELYSAGCLGLAKAINNFDSSRGLCFSTYAFPVITGELKRLFRDGGAVKVSRSLKELAIEINRINEKSKAENGRELTLSELAQRLNTSVEKIVDAINCVKSPLSLNCEYEDDSAPRVEVATDDIQYEISERLSLEQAISTLEENDRKIIRLRYYGNKTQSQTAKILNMTQVQISRREKKILLQIRQKLAN